MKITILIIIVLLTLNYVNAYTTEEIYTTGYAGTYSSSALDTNGFLHVSFKRYYELNHTLGYCNNIGGSWSCEIIDADTDSSLGHHSSIALDSNNKVYISHYNDTGGDLRFCTNLGGSFVCETIETTDDVGKYSSIAIDTNNKPHIAHLHDDGTYDALRYCNKTSGSWSCEQVNNIFTDFAFAGIGTSMTIDSNNIIHISTYESYDLKLLYYNKTGSVWANEMIDDDSGYSSTSIATDSNDKIHISHCTYPNRNLGYCTNQNNSWVCSDIDIGTNYGERNSIAIDSQDKVHISHYISLNDLIRYCVSSDYDIWDCEQTITTYSYVNYGRSMAIKQGRLSDSTSFSNHVYASFYNSTIQDLYLLNLSDYAKPDTIAPIITIVSPTNTSYPTNTILFNVTLDEAGSLCLYSLDDATNVTMTKGDDASIWNSQNTTMTEGYHTVKYYCNDTHSNMNTSSLELGFSVNSKEIIFSDYKKDITPNEDQDVQVNVTIDQTSNNVILELDTTTNYTITTHNGLEYYFTFNSDNYTTNDTVAYYWYAYNLGNKLNKSVQQSFVVVNRQPMTTTPTMIPTIAYSTTSELMCENSTTSDQDNDVITFHYEWYKNDVALSLNHKNITNTNYTSNDVMICEIWVSDPYETNTTKHNSSSITITPISPVINNNYTYLSDDTIDMTPRYDETIKFNANVTDDDLDIEGVYFTLLSPNGSYVINNMNGTVYDSDLWNSTTYTIDYYGDWQINITTNDTTGLTDSYQYNFTVSLGTPTKDVDDKIYSQKAGETESFNIIFSHTGNSNNTFNITEYEDMTNTSRFVIKYYNANTNIEIINNFTVIEDTSYLLKVNITSNNTLESNTYSGNITFERIEDNTKMNLSVSATISALTGNVVLTPSSWSISMNSISSSSNIYRIENDGDYNLTHCNASISGWDAYDSYNISDFDIGISNYSDIYVTISNLNSGIYSKSLLLTCISTANDGIDTDSSSISATITQYTEPVAPSGGGGPDRLPDTVCGNGICEWDETWNESDTSKTFCPVDCLSVWGNMSLKFDIMPKSYTLLFSSTNEPVTRNIKIKNYNSDVYLMNVTILCANGDPSCSWVLLHEEYTNTYSRNIQVSVPAGNIDKPGVVLVDYIIQPPEDIDDYFDEGGDKHFQFTIYVSNQTIGYYAASPIYLDFSFEGLTWFVMLFWDAGTKFVDSFDDEIHHFERSVFGIEGIYMIHIYIILGLILISASLYSVMRYSKKYKKKWRKAYNSNTFGAIS